MSRLMSVSTGPGNAAWTAMPVLASPAAQSLGHRERRRAWNAEYLPSGGMLVSETTVSTFTMAA
jgi:hypothetical protein